MSLSITGKRWVKMSPWLSLYCWTYICVHIRYRNENPSLQNEFPWIEIGLFDPEFDSASNDITFNHGKTMGENVTLIVSRLLYIYMCPCTISERESRSSEWIPVDWNRSIRSRIWFCIEWCHFQSRENVGWKCHLDRFDYCWTYICVHVWCPRESSPLQNEFPSIEIGLFDPEFDSASNDVTFNHGENDGWKCHLDCLSTVGHIYVSIYDIGTRIPLFRMNSRELK